MTAKVVAAEVHADVGETRRGEAFGKAFRVERHEHVTHVVLASPLVVERTLAHVNRSRPPGGAGYFRT